MKSIAVKFFLILGIGLIVLALQPRESLACHAGGWFKGGHINAFFDLSSAGFSTSSSTTGTSGCKVWHIADGTLQEIRQAFVENELNALTEEAAQGSGPHLNALAQLMGCSEEAFSEFSLLTKNYYSPIFENSDELPGGEQAELILTRLGSFISQDRHLDTACRIAS